jgi:hypothetical protein
MKTVDEDHLVLVSMKDLISSHSNKANQSEVEFIKKINELKDAFSNDRQVINH